MLPKFRVLKIMAAAAALAALPGCVSVQAIEPVINPPAQFQLDASVPVEFVAPVLVGLRCAERGAKFLGLPGLNSGACSDRSLMTFPDPCFTVTGGWYADVLCQSIKDERELEAAPPQTDGAPNAKPSPPAAGNAVLIQAAWRETGSANPAVHASGRARTLTASAAAPKPAANAAASAGLGFTPPSIQVEFVAPDEVAFRCAERGAKFLPGSDSGACADKHLITIANPCTTPDGGWYARTLCHEMAHANGWPADHRGGSLLHRSAAIRPASESPEAMAYAVRATRRLAATAALAEQAALEAPASVPADFNLGEALPVGASAVDFALLTGDPILMLPAEAATADDINADAAVDQAAPAVEGLAEWSLALILDPDFDRLDCAA